MVVHGHFVCGKGSLGVLEVWEEEGWFVFVGLSAVGETAGTGNLVCALVGGDVGGDL